MRSFLIRDILSGPAANQAANQAAGSLGESSTSSHHNHHHNQHIEEEDSDEEDDEEIEVDIEDEKVGSIVDATTRHFYPHNNNKRVLSSTKQHEDYGEQDVNVKHEAEGEIGSTNRSSSQQQSQSQQQQQLLGKQFLHLNSPLDALFQMTSTIDALKRGEKRKDRDADQTNFTSKQTSKKKRKSRTAFTNNQIYELERRFRMQKYLSPTDRDEIALTLNLSNAQVITWFQNRRAKLKRDLEEQKRDIETASLLNFHKTFFESLQVLSQMNSDSK